MRSLTTADGPHVVCAAKLHPIQGRLHLELVGKSQMAKRAQWRESRVMGDYLARFGGSSSKGVLLCRVLAH